MSTRLTVEDRGRMEAAARGMPTKSAKIRALDRAGFERARIAEFLGIRYQFVRNVLGAPRHEPEVHPSSPSEDGSGHHFGACVVDPDGHVSLPGAVLAALGARPGDSLPWRFEDDELVIMGRDAGLKFAQSLAASKAPGSVSWTEQLWADRRAEVAGEDRSDARG
jgi:hypothetical protein